MTVGVCDLCHCTRELGPATKFVDSVGHFIPVRICASCVGPAVTEDEKRTASMYQARRERA